jgi:hypothetical protein
VCQRLNLLLIDNRFGDLGPNGRKWVRGGPMTGVPRKQKGLLLEQKTIFSESKKGRTQLERGFDPICASFEIWDGQHGAVNSLSVISVVVAMVKRKTPGKKDGGLV